MSEVRCASCDESFEGSRVVCCPTCLAKRWLATPNLVREKHDPRHGGDPHPEYRSIVTARFVADLSRVLAVAAAEGTWFRDTGYGMLVHVTPLPLGRAPGVGIPAGRRSPEHALDCLFIAEADSAEQAHVFAVDGERHQSQVRAGVFEPLGGCGQQECRNLALPTHPTCLLHADEALLAWPA